MGTFLAMTVGVEFRQPKKNVTASVAWQSPKRSTMVPIRRLPRHEYMTRDDGGC